MRLTLKAILLGSLAVYRTARITSKEDGPFFIFDKLRKYTDYRRFEEEQDNRKLAELGIPFKPEKFWFSLDEGVRCPYCMGVWYSFFFALIVPKLGFRERVLYAFGVCGLQALIQLVEDKYL